MNLDLLFLLGRVLFGGYFLYNAFNHFMNAESMGQYAGSKGVPAPTLAVLGSGVLLAIGGGSILLGYYPSWGVGALVLFLIPVTFMMHDFWDEEGDQRQMQIVQFGKNMALLGASLMFLLLEQPWPYSLGG